MIERDVEYLRCRPVQPSAPATPPPDTSSELSQGVSRAAAFEWGAGSFAPTKRTICRDARLSATYFWGGGEEKTAQICKGGKAGILQRKIKVGPILIDSSGEIHYDFPGVFAALALAGYLLVERLSVAATMRRMDRDGIPSAGNVATSPNPVGKMADCAPRLPSGVTIVRARDAAQRRDPIRRRTGYTHRWLLES